MPGVTLKQVKYGGVDLWCDTTDGNIRPLVPLGWRKMLAKTFHDLNHPGPRATALKVNERYYWPNLKRDVEGWTKNCVPCQSVKSGNAAIKPPMDHRPVLGRFDDLQ